MGLGALLHTARLQYCKPKIKIAELCDFFYMEECVFGLAQLSTLRWMVSFSQMALIVWRTLVNEIMMECDKMLFMQYIYVFR